MKMNTCPFGQRHSHHKSCGAFYSQNFEKTAGRESTVMCCLDRKKNYSGSTVMFIFPPPVVFKGITMPDRADYPFLQLSLTLEAQLLAQFAITDAAFQLVGLNSPCEKRLTRIWCKPLKFLVEVVRIELTAS